MPAPTGQLARVLDDLTGGLLDGKEYRDRQTRYSGGHEAEQQVKLEVSGEASNGVGFADQDVHFPYPFLWAPAQRECPFALPHFTFGIEMRLTSDSPVLIQAQVKEWIKDSASRILGARVRFFAQAPNTETPVPYSAIAHLKFQGWAAESELGEQ